MLERFPMVKLELSAVMPPDIALAWNSPLTYNTLWLASVVIATCVQILLVITTDEESKTVPFNTKETVPSKLTLA